ncbi:class I SAM-dependent methyltransferase [Candidatus Falkowbacteria bacterium]|nr:class I SAM-dependent methyltransferase [Candidatus Falkowbacteria bacterium]
MNREIFQQEIEDWNNNVRFYINENSMAYQGKIYRKEIYDFYQIKTEEKVLEAGGGVVKVGENTIVVDFSPKMIEACKKINGEGRCVLASAHQLPFKDEEFDVVVANGLSHHLKAQDLLEDAIKEFYRVLKSGGKLCVFDRANNFFPRLFFLIRTPSRLIFKPTSSCNTRNEADFLEEDIDKIIAGGFKMARRKYIINVFFQAITIFANVLQYVFGFRVAYWWQKITWSLAYLVEKALPFKIFCAEQVIVFKKIAES